MSSRYVSLTDARQAGSVTICAGRLRGSVRSRPANRTYQAQNRGPPSCTELVDPIA
jgi:hypothetical protein